MPKKVAVKFFSQNCKKSPKLAEKVLKKQNEQKFKFPKKNLNSFGKI